MKSLLIHLVPIIVDVVRGVAVERVVDLTGVVFVAAACIGEFRFGPAFAATTRFPQAVVISFVVESSEVAGLSRSKESFFLGFKRM